MTNQLPEKHKGRKAVKYRAAECLNCGHPLELSDVYCAYCGQLNTTKSLSLKDFFGEFIGSIITYDSKFRSTLKDLLFKPGVITRNYVHGQRLKYANPFRFYLSVSIIYFIVQGLIASLGGGGPFQIKPSSNSNDAINPKVEIPNLNVLDSLPPEATFVAKQFQADSLAKKYGYPNNKQLDSIIKSAAKKDTIQSYDFIAEDSLQQMNWGDRVIERFSLYRDFYKTTKIKDPLEALDSLKHPNNQYNRWAYQKNEAIEQIEENPTDFIRYLLDKTPFFLFFFTPIYALFFWLIYSKKKHTYMEHMIFIFHIFSFVFLAMLIFLIPDTILDTEIFNGILFGLIGPFYLYKAMRNFYKNNRIVTILKFVFLNIVFWLSASLGAVLFFAVSAALY